MRFTRLIERVKKGMVLVLTASMLISSDMVPAFAAENTTATTAAITTEAEEVRDVAEETEEPKATETPEKKESNGDENVSSPEEDENKKEASVSENNQTESDVSEDATEENEASVSEATVNEVESVASEEDAEDETAGEEEAVAIPAPTNVKTVFSKNDKISISWKKSKGANYYIIYRMNDEGTFTKELTTINKTKFVDYEVSTHNNVYKIVPYGTDAAGRTGEGAPAYAICTPKIVSAYRRDDSAKKEENSEESCRMNVDFTTIRGKDVSYVLERSYANKKNFGSVEKVTFALDGEAVPAGQDRLVDGDSMTSGAYYYYRVKASITVDGKDYCSAYSTPVRGRVTERAPKMVSANSVTGTKVSVTWEDMKDILSDTDYYQVYYSTKEDGKYKALGKKIPANSTSLTKSEQMLAGNKVSAVSYICTNLKPETEYYFKVAVIKNRVTGALSEISHARTLLTDLEGISAKAKNFDSITISWNQVDGASYYNLYCTAPLTEAETENPENWTFPTVIKVNSKAKKGVVTYTKTKLLNAEYYGFYAVPAYGKNEHEQDTKAVSVFAKTRIATPTSVKATTLDPETVKVSWKKVTGATGYKITYSYGGIENGGSIYKTVGSSTTSFKVTELEAAIPVTYKVQAVCKSNNKTAEADIFSEASEETKTVASPDVATIQRTFYNRDGLGAQIVIQNPKVVAKNSKIIYRIYRSTNSKKPKSTDTYSDYTAGNNEAGKTVYIYDNNELADGKKIYYHIYTVVENTQAKDGGYEAVSTKFATKAYCTPTSVTMKEVKVPLGSSKKISVTLKPTDTTMKQIKDWKLSKDKNDNFDDYKALDKNTASNKYIKIESKYYYGKDNYYGYTSSLTITGKAKGSTYILVETMNGHTKAFKVVVTEAELDDTHKSKVIVLDAGHGGSESGATSGGLVEKNMTLTVAKKTRNYLKDAGFTVYMTRTDDTKMSVEDRVKYAEYKGAKVLVSQHFNSNNGGASGVEAYYSKNYKTTEAQNLASKLTAKTSSVMGIGNRGPKTRDSKDYPGKDYYGINRYGAEKKIIAVIIENGFLQADGNKMNSDSDLDRIAKANADAIIEWYNGY